MRTPILLLLLFITLSQSNAQENKQILYVGTYSVRGSEGIYVLEFDPKAITLTIKQTIAGPESPTYLEIHPSGKFLYTANRGSVDGITKKNASVSAYSIDSQTGGLKFINSRPSFGLGSCHINIDPGGMMAVASQFQEGTLAVYALLKDGSLGLMTDSIRYSGYGLDPERQKSSHIHSANFLPGNQFIYVTDLGTDKIYLYRYDSHRGKLILSDQPYINTKPGTGPRHISFHPNGKYFYLAEELTSSVGVFSFNNNTGVITTLEDQITSLPENFRGTNSTADIHASPDGRFLYLSNRGLNAISIFSISKNGKITLISQQATMGKTPRSFIFSKNGEYTFVTNQDSDNIVVFKRDQKTGLMNQTGIDLKIPSPVCVKVLN